MRQQQHATRARNTYEYNKFIMILIGKWFEKKRYMDTTCQIKYTWNQHLIQINIYMTGKLDWQIKCTWKWKILEKDCVKWKILKH